MDGYEYEQKALWPMWNKEREMEFTSQNANASKDMRERLKNELGLEIKKDPIDMELNLRSKIVKNPDNFFPELSPDYEFMKSTKKSKWG